MGETREFWTILGEDYNNRLYSATHEGGRGSAVKKFREYEVRGRAKWDWGTLSSSQVEVIHLPEKTCAGAVDSFNPKNLEPRRNLS